MIPEHPENEPWSRQWYPLAFTQDLREHPQRLSIHDHGFALFRPTPDRWSCLLDRCPHRAARLSDGEVIDGRLSCLYHGWQLGGDGRCTHIPQLLDGQKIPAKAHVPAFPLEELQGMLWLRPNRSDGPGPEIIPTIPELDQPDCSSVDFAIDLPYEQSFLIENVIDIAHIHVAHHGIRGGGHRDLAAPIDFVVSQATADGFSASFRSIGLEGGSALRGARVHFKAPNLVHYESLYENPELSSGLALYSLPVGRNRCRLLYRAYSNFWRMRDRLRPRWLEHWTQCTILEQDMDVVLGQVQEMLRTERSPRKLWLPLKTSDALVIAYRKWLDQHPHLAPSQVGFDRVDPADGPADAFDRYHMHTAQCGSCSRAHDRLVKSKTPLALSTVALLALAAATAGSPVSAPAALLALLAASGRSLVDRLERRFL